MKPFIRFLLVAYVTALFFELLAHLLDPLNRTFDNVLLGIPFFIVWYGLLYSIAYFLFRSRPWWMPVLAFAIVGTIAEILLFKRLNIFIDPIIYAVMAFVPFRFGRSLT